MLTTQRNQIKQMIEQWRQMKKLDKAMKDRFNTAKKDLAASAKKGLLTTRVKK